LVAAVLKPSLVGRSPRVAATKRASAAFTYHSFTETKTARAAFDIDSSMSGKTSRRMSVALA